MYPSFSHKLSYYSPASHPSFAQSKLPIRILNKLGKQSAHDWSSVYSTPVLWSEKKKFSWYFIKLISFILMSFQQMAFVTTLCQAVFGTGNRWDPSLSSSSWPFCREVGGNIIDASLAEYSPLGKLEKCQATLGKEWDSEFPAWEHKGGWHLNKALEEIGAVFKEKRRVKRREKEELKAGNQVRTGLIWGVKRSG